MAALPCFTKAKTQMKLHPNEFIELILKDRVPWAMVPILRGYPLLIFWLLACGMRHSNPRLPGPMDLGTLGYSFQSLRH